MSTSKKPETKVRPVIQVIEVPKDTSKRKLFVALAVGLCLSLTGYALNVNNFTDYSPPDYLYINWGDYVYGTGDNMAMNNAPTGSPRETAQYPYRSVFYGRTDSNESSVLRGIGRHKLSALQGLSM